MVDLSKFIDNSLKSEFEAKPYDVTKDRTKLVKRFESALNQFNQGQTKVPNRLWKVSNNVVEFKVPLGAGDLSISGSTVNYLPASQFPGFIAALIEATNSGDFDGAFKAIDVAPAAGGAPKATRNLSETSRLNIRVAAFRRGGKTEAEMRKLLSDEGVDKAAIDAALAYKAPKK
ncbi:hypothetical protein [Sphingobium xenophagum]|uniref:hypothetical protein n=1 Tax=Sphingobium xenophagum TaxID=121428 RepID=UPI001C0AE746|nr:hypothetical protein [Sphingobium xenophagum]QWT15305.1 hypothetical protein GTV57_06080 [Sphingobium xenophagum]